MTTDTSRRTARTGRKRGNNEGSIYQRKDGLWTCQVTLPSGKRKYIYGKSRKEVADELTSLLRAVQQGVTVPTQRLTFGSFLDRWLTDVVAPGTAPSTYESYERLVRLHIAPALGHLQLTAVSAQRIQQFLNEKRAAGLSPRMVQYLHATIRNALKQAYNWDLVGSNPAIKVKPPKLSRTRVEAMTPEQARAVVEAFQGHRLRPVIGLTLALGLRCSEVLGLRWSDVDLDARTVTIRGQYQRVGGAWMYRPLKTDGSDRTLGLPAFAATLLREHRVAQAEMRLRVGSMWQPYDLVFPRDDGTPQDRTSVSHMFAKRIRQAGLPRMRFHDLRHGAASLLLAEGHSLREIMEILGHSQIAITANLYAHVAPEVVRKAAASMDRVFGTS